VRDGKGDLPIHAACRKGPFQTIQFLADQDPATLRIEDRKSALSIHCACQAIGTLQVIEMLVERGGVGTIGTTQDRYGALPLHALFCSSNPLLDAVKYLVDAYPASLTAQMHSGELPIMVLACEESASLNVTNYLQRRAPHLVCVPK